MPLDPSSVSVRELREQIQQIDDAEVLQTIYDAEQEGKDRTTAKEALSKRLGAVDADDADAGDTDDESSDPDVAYPAPDSDDVVVYDRGGAGDTGTAEPPIAGHDTIHLLAEDGGPVCGASVGANADEVPRSTLATDIDECQPCLRQ